MPERLGRGFFARRTETVAREVLGQVLVSVVRGVRRAGLIVETEAYLGVKDLAAHTKNGRRTERVEPMWAEPGTWYVFLTYGVHHCLNVSTKAEGEPEAVLIRALEPVEGAESMRRARSGAGRSAGRKDAKMRDVQLCSGPGKLCQALGVTRGLSGSDSIGSQRLWIERGPGTRGGVGRSARIGVDYAGEWAGKPLRYFDHGSAHVSRGRPSV